MLLIGGIFEADGQICVFDSLGEDFLLKDFSVLFDFFDLGRRQKLKGIVKVVNFNDLAVGN